MHLLSIAVVFASLAAVQGSSIESGFEPREATISSVHSALFGGTTTCRDVVSSFLARIEKYNAQINAIVTLNREALLVADELDLALAAGNTTGALFCIPMLLKDNYNTKDMITTGGCLDLKESQPSVDAPAVDALRKAGAVILGKTNLHELALEGLSVSSSGGQTLNPYNLNRTPGGSSGGTGAAIAASLAVLGTGSDTVNSLRSPASSNSLFTIRSTRGLISRSGIVPISYTQDGIGPIARSIEDVATALTVMASVGYDPADNTTALVPPTSTDLDYSTSTYGGSLKGVRLGLLTTFFNQTASDETTPVNEALDAMVASLTKAGAIIVPINESIYNSTALSNNCDVQKFEFRESMDAYLQEPTLHGTHPQTLQELYSSGKFLVIPSQYSFVNTSLVSSTSNSTYFSNQRAISDLIVTVESTFKANQLDALIYPEQSNLVVPVGSPSQSGRNGILAGVTGFPVVVVPAGFSPATEEAPVGIPIGMEIMGLPWTEPKLLNIAARISETKRIRRMPKLTEMPVEVGYYESVPTITPDTKDIPKAYPVGVLY